MFAIRTALQEAESQSYPAWMSARVRRACAKYPNFSGKFPQEMEVALMQFVLASISLFASCMCRFESLLSTTATPICCIEHL